MNLTAPSAPVHQWLERLPADKVPLVARARLLIATVAPDAHEIVYHGALCYGPTESARTSILYLSVFRAYCNLGFYYGGYVADPEHLLIGSGKRMRHIKLRSAEDCASPALARLLAAAWSVGLEQVARQIHR